ncbi:MAG: hypothetical protein IID53_07215 [Proteobacteria bacterium]|nr:hypothetical protein [Pseudomonadota bacterium]
MVADHRSGARFSGLVASARISLPLCGVVKEVIKAIKIERGHPMPGALTD